MAKRRSHNVHGEKNYRYDASFRTRQTEDTGRIHGEPHRQFSAILGWQALQDAIDHFGENHPYTALCPKLKDVDPDDAFSTVRRRCHL